MLKGATCLAVNSAIGATDMREVMVGKRRAARIIWKADMTSLEIVLLGWQDAAGVGSLADLSQ